MKVIHIFCVILLTILVGCKKEGEEVTDECWRLNFSDGRATLKGAQINGDPLPYYPVYIDDENYTEITAFKIYFKDDGTWTSEMDYVKEVEGQFSRDDVKREGTYSCSSDDYSSYAFLVESDGSEYGTLEWDESTDFTWILRTGDNEYLFY